MDEQGEGRFESALVIRGLRKSYGPVLAVDDVDLDVGRGEIVGLVGKNGAGKSSLIKVVTGAAVADAGSVSLRGRRVAFHGPADARRQGLAFVHQELNLVPGSSVAENIVLGAGYPRRKGGWFVDWSQLHRHTAELMQSVDLTGVGPQTKIDELSAVQQRQVMIAAALWHRPSVLILDEPTASLSEREILQLHRIVRSLRDAGTGVLYVSHRLDEVLALTSRVVVMRDGSVHADELTSGITKARLVQLISGGSEEEEKRHGRQPEPSSATVLEVDGVTTRRLTDPVSFSVRAGEVLGIGGLVGAGRSELLHAVYGSDPRVSGTVRLDGRVVPANPRASLHAGISLLTEDRRLAGLLTYTSVAENIGFARLGRLRRHGRIPSPSPQAERRLARSTIRELSIKTSRGDAPVLSLSGGNQQKVLLGRWLATRPRVLLLDEPTLGVDVESKAETYALIHRLADRGLAVIVVSSEFRELELLCDRSLVMREGAIVAELHGAEVTEAALLRACFGAQREIVSAATEG